MTNQPPYRAAGTFAGEVYVTRAADERLLAAIHRNDRFPYIVAPRQSGKSSLLLRTRASLDRAHFRWAFVDVSTLPVADYEQFWRELLVEVARTASLPQQDITPNHPEDTLSAWLRHYPQRLTIFLDEIDAVVGLAFRDQFLGKLRSLFNTRAEDPNFDRLMLVLAGATAPTQLIQDPARSPFNVGVEIRLDDLTLSLTESLASHLDQTNAAIALGVPSRLLHWTGGSVYLAQLLLEDLWQVGTQRRAIEIADVDAAATAIVARAAGEIHFQNIYRLVADRPLSLDALSDLCAGRSIEASAAQDLRLAGISDGVSPFRNPIYRLVFGVTGSLRLTHASETVGPAPDSATTSASQCDSPAAGRHEPLGKLSALVDTLFCGEAAQYGHYTRSDDPPEVLIPDTLIRFVLIDADQQRVNLQLYHGLSAFGGALWSREVRALTRVSWRQHPALPTIVGGAYIEAYNVAFVITTVARFRLSEPGALAFIAQDRSEAIRQFMLLAQGLGILHEQGITHRNLHPGAIEYIESDSDEARRYTLRLSRFEMSAMVSNLARHRMSHEQLLGEQLRRLYLESDGAALALAYCPPERAEWLFDGESTRPENDRADVYALGVLGWHWFVRRWNDQPAWLAPERSSAWVRRLNQHMLASLVNNPDVPPLLAVLLREMLAPEPSDRISIFNVIEALTRDYGRLVASAATSQAPETLYIGFMPVESEKTIYRWGWIQQDPREPTGRKELQEFLEMELQAAEILYCADGFAAYRAGHSKREQDALRSARYVLVGKQAYWFCDLYRSADLMFDPHAQSFEQLLLIKYVVHRHRAWRLEATPLRRPIPGVLQFVPILAHGTLDLDLIRANGASWRPLLASVRHEQSTPAWMQDMESALTFLQAFRRAELEARVFPYAQKDGGGLTVDLTFDTSRDRKYQFSDALRSLYFREFRVPMGRLFESLDGERSVQFSVYGDLHGRPNYEAGPVLSLLFDRRLDDDTVRMYNPRGRRGLPTQGWICPEDDRGSFVQLQRQANAVQELLHARSLLHQLHHPSAIRGSRARWKGVGDELKGRSNQIVQDMLSYEPFYALHGPPGSGKTTVAATAVAAYLATDPAYRVLISSQSHNALDNLGRRILHRCQDDITVVRIASATAVAGEKVHPDMVRRLPANQARAAIERITDNCAAALANDRLANKRPLDEPLRALLRDWADQAPRVELELRDRIRRGANIVFATTGACTERDVSTANGMYDWVIVEEAARAWPTELAQPLVRGLRWTLIGDHYQLPAFDDISVQRFLALCATSEDEELQAHGGRGDAYRAVFRLFGSLFDERARRTSEIGPGSTRLAEPLDELDLQFRMHEDICRIVARAFYRERNQPRAPTQKPEDGWLTTDPSANRSHPLQRPRALRGHAAIWIDTQNVPDSNDLRAWKNPGEAEVIQRLLAQMQPTPPRGDEKFALLTPYNEQIAQLRLANLPDWVDSRIYTTDGFQGREADIVVVSLVRSVQRDANRPEANIGHLVSPNRVNVLLSRARTLLVVVGRIDHFDQQATLDRKRKDLHFWNTVVDEFRRQDGVFDAVDMLGKDGAW